MKCRPRVVNVCAQARAQARASRAEIQFVKCARCVIECVDIVFARCEVERVATAATSEFENTARSVLCEDALGAAARFARCVSKFIGRLAIRSFPMISLCVERGSRGSEFINHLKKIRYRVRLCLALKM